jgi:hypothetical protein
MKGGKKGDTDKGKKENPWIHVRSSSKAFVQGQPGREDEVEGKVDLLTGCNAISFLS